MRFNENNNKNNELNIGFIYFMTERPIWISLSTKLRVVKIRQRYAILFLGIQLKAIQKPGA